jgi:hypothetical protein
MDNLLTGYDGAGKREYPVAEIARSNEETICQTMIAA